MGLLLTVYTQWYASWWGLLIVIVLSILVGGAAGFFISRAVFKKELKKNPPVNAKMIRIMFQQMGRKPSENEINRILKSINDAN